MLSGDNSILQRATTAKENTERTKIVENARLDVLAQITENKGNDISEKQFKTILNKYFSNVPSTIPEDLAQLNLTSINSGYIINGKEIYGGTIKKTISKPTDIFVALYNDGTLVFSNNMNDIDTSKIQTNYGNIKDSDYAFSDMYNSEITKINIINEIVPTTCSKWFDGLYCVTEIDNIENLDTSNVTDMSYMFYACESLLQVDVSTFDTSNVTTMKGMFGSWDDFGAIRSVIGLENFNELNLNNFDTSNVTDMKGMFCYVHNVDQLDLSNFDTNKVSNYIDMFHGCYEINEDRECKVIIGPNWNTTMTESATGYSGTFESTN